MTQTIPPGRGARQAGQELSRRLDTALYPPLQAEEHGYLPLDATHTMYWERFGNPGGIPIVILHGGPGGSIRPYYRQLVDPEVYRGICYDQRGCGRSTPTGELTDNSTMHLVADLERLREHLGVEQWVVMGGSWGSTLALVYAEQFPGRVAGLMVSGVFLGRDVDRQWWWHDCRYLFPEVWRSMVDWLPEPEREAYRESYLRRILDPDPASHEPAALALMSYEAQLLDLLPDQGFVSPVSADPGTVTMGRLFAHYDANRSFLQDDQLIAQASRLHGIPGFVVNGRYDACTPPRSAWDLHCAWQGSRLLIAPMSGHRWNDELLARAVVQATDTLGRELS